MFEQPKLTHLQISDLLQEFLGINDLKKLIEFDNRKLFDFQKLSNRDPKVMQTWNMNKYSSNLNRLVQGIV